VTILFCDRAIVTIYGTIVTILSLIVTNSHYLGPIGQAVPLEVINGRVASGESISLLESAVSTSSLRSQSIKS